MSLSFEEMADAGNTVPQESKSTSNKKPKLVRGLTAVLLGSCCFLGLGFALSIKSDPAITEAATILLSEDLKVTHTLDTSTEFKEALDLLDVSVKAPEYRETQDAPNTSEVVAVKPEKIEIRERDPETSELLVKDETEAKAGLSVASFTDVREVVQEKLWDDKASGSAEKVDRDWGGIILVPDLLKFAKAYTSQVRLVRIEAHPIDGERLRVWARVKNISNKDITTAVGCEFRSIEIAAKQASFTPAKIAKGETIDVYFDSPRDRVEAYTVLVKKSI